MFTSVESILILKLLSTPFDINLGFTLKTRNAIFCVAYSGNENKKKQARVCGEDFKMKYADSIA